MPVVDPIADMLTRIRNAIMVRQESATVPASSIKLDIARVLKEEGFIRDYTVVKGRGVQGAIRVFLLYQDRKKPYLTGLLRVSKPGLRRYVRCQRMPLGKGGRGISIVSTPQGVMTGREAKRRGVGGELLCYVW